MRDLSILRAIGVKKKFLKGIIFFEDFLIIIVSTGFALGLSLLLSIFLLGQTAILPPIIIVFGLWLAISAIIILIRRLSIEYNFKDIGEIIMQYLKNH
jgi:ABC-type antimicrobial peptide transport system permease subunit